MKTKPRVLPVGEYSSGTMRAEHILPKILYELDRIRLTRAERSNVAHDCGKDWRGEIIDRLD